MDLVATWFKESLIYHLIGYCSKIWHHSFLRRGFIRAGSIILSSRISRGLSAYFHRRFRPRQALVYRLHRKFQIGLIPLKKRISKIIGSSFIWRIASQSKSMGVLFRYLIPLSGFFVFFDELG